MLKSINSSPSSDDSEINAINILVVEDERKLARLIERLLTREGYKVDLAFDGEEAEQKAKQQEFHFIILDINLPRRTGFDVLQNLRSQSYNTPVLILSARDKVEDRIKGLQLGAVDFLVKPFDSGELLARTKAILQRSGIVRTNILKADDLVLDVVKRRVTRAGKVIDLSPKEYALLEFFLHNKNQVLTRKRIAEQVWGYTFDTGTNILDVYISYLRNAIDEGFTKKLIHTVRGEGFMLSEK